MRDRIVFESLVESAKERIREVFRSFGYNRVCVAYSGGKDSKAVLRLTRSVFPNVLVIHNEHEGEFMVEPGVLVVKEPKAENVPQFLKTVAIDAQLDGTRQDEDDQVFINGELIHRSKMEEHWTSNGVWGLFCCFPIYDWTEEDVMRYLAESEPVKVSDAKVSYEGEGSGLGLKTFFCHFPGKDDVSNLTLCGVDAIYVKADKVTDALVNWVKSLGLRATIEVEWKNWHYRCVEGIQWFVVVDSLVMDMPHFNGFVKVRVQVKEEFEKALSIANWFGSMGHDVLLMPEYDDPDIGKVMVEALPSVNRRVRLMPPVQNLLGIE